MSLADKLDYQQVEDIKKKCVIENGGESFCVSSISPLPYGYMFSFDYENGFPFGSFCVNFSNEVNVLPDCDFAYKLKRFLEDYLRKKHK